MSKRVLSSLLLSALLSVALVPACPLVPIGTQSNGSDENDNGSDETGDNDNDNDLDNEACTCVADECIAPQALATIAPPAPRELPAGLQDLSSANCLVTATDDQARPIGYRCFDAEEIAVVYGDGRLESVTTTSLLNSDQVEVRSFVWDGDLLVAEVVEQRRDGVVAFRERRTFRALRARIHQYIQTLVGTTRV